MMVHFVSFLVIYCAILANILNAEEHYYIEKWASSTPLPYDSDLMIAGYDSDLNMIKIIGGRSGGGSQNLTYQYDITSQITIKWCNNSTPIWVPYANTYISLHNKIYFSNSHAAFRGTLTNFFTYDMKDDSIDRIGITYPKPHISWDECYATDGERYIFVLGNNSWTNIFLIFDVTTNIWSYGANLTEARQTSACIYSHYDSMLYVFGGFVSSTIEKYSYKTDEWQLINAKLAQNANYYLSTYTVQGSNTIFIVGASNSNNDVCNMLYVDIQSISTCSRRDIVLSYFAAVFVDDLQRYYTFGGWNFASSQSSNVIQYAVTVGPTPSPTSGKVNTFEINMDTLLIMIAIITVGVIIMVIVVVICMMKYKMKNKKPAQIPMIVPNANNNDDVEPNHMNQDVIEGHIHILDTLQNDDNAEYGSIDENV